MTRIKHTTVQSRNENFAERLTTRIWEESSNTDNPYIAESSRCHGYDTQALMQQRSFIDVFYLLFRGELPDREQAQLLEQLMISLINPGPRHPATRAAMNAGVGKTESTHILPIALSILGGEHLGAGCIEASMRFLRKQSRTDPLQAAQQMMDTTTPPNQGDWNIAPGFGSRYGGIDRIAEKVAKHLCTLPASGKCLAWGQQFSQALKDRKLGWHMTGIAAAVFADLGFQPRMGSGLFQMMSAPGLFAHGIELANKPTTAMPFVKDENYVIE